MTDTPDTSPETVERLIAGPLNEISRSKGLPVTDDDVDACRAVAATLRALSTERDALKAENVRLREEKECAIDTLNTWFDRRKLAHEDIDDAVLNAARGYLRTSRSGGMDQEYSDMVEGVISDMARLSVFADLFARVAMKEKDT